MRLRHAYAAHDGDLCGTRQAALELFAQRAHARILQPGAQVGLDVRGGAPPALPQKDDEVAHVRQVRRDAVAAVRALEIALPQAELTLAHAQRDARECRRVQCIAQRAEGSEVGRVREGEAVERVEQRRGFRVELPACAQQRRGEMQGLRIRGEQQCGRGGEKVCVDAVAKLAREPE